MFVPGRVVFVPAVVSSFILSGVSGTQDAALSAKARSGERLSADLYGSWFLLVSDPSRRRLSD